MPIKKVLSTGKRPVKIYTDDIEPEAEKQLHELSTLPFIHKHVAAMPDVHLGIGATIGSVIPTKAAIIPAAVGVDLGCGMSAVQLSLNASDLPDNLSRLRAQIEQAIPVGFNMHHNPVIETNALLKMSEPLDVLLQKHPTVIKMKKNFHDDWQLQVGTLGGGNHFIEVCLDENQQVWIMLHSGSRGIGNVIGRYFIELARKDMEKWFIQLPNKDLAYFPEGTEHFDDYWQAVQWAQEYARVNRQEMMRLILETLPLHLPPFQIMGEVISCHHNYVARENHYKSNILLTRKGAIRARKGDWGIIPGSMGTKSYIVKGKGNPESFCSCSHGAGRRMGRKEAKRRFNVEDMATQTQGVECRKDEDVIDEIPAAYKPIDEVMANQNDLVEIAHTLKQVVCIKG